MAVLAVVATSLFAATAVQTRDVATTSRVAGAGANPWTGLIHGTDGNLYKTASAGRSAGGGVVFRSVPGFFDDVPPGDPLHAFIRTVARDGIAAAAIDYCPDNPVTRAQMAVFLLRAEHGSIYTPPACTGLFGDVECTPTPAFAVNWIEALYNEGITGGCSASPLLYCPDQAVTRAQMAVFLLRAEHGSIYTPPACGGLFGDVECTPTPAFAVNWIEALHNEGVTGGCSASPLLYCPDQAVTRAQMAVFLLRVEHGSIYTPPACTPPGIFQDVPCTTISTVPVTIENILFSPSAVTVTVGDTVKWTWNSGVVSHSTTSGVCSTSCVPDGRWDSGVHSTPNTFSFTFTSAGTYPYYCRIHGAPMTGTVQVNPPAFARDWIEQLYREGITGGCGSPPAATPTPTPTPAPPPTPTPPCYPYC